MSCKHDTEVIMGTVEQRKRRVVTVLNLAAEEKCSNCLELHFLGPRNISCHWSELSNGRKCGHYLSRARGKEIELLRLRTMRNLVTGLS